MKTITKNTRITALIAALLIAIFAPQYTWAMAPAASRTAVLTGQLPARLAAQRAAQLAPALYPAAARLGLTGRSGTPAQTQKNLNLQNQQAREQSLQRAQESTARIVAQQRAFEAKKIEQAQARSQTLGQRIASPRTVGTGIKSPLYQSPLAGRTGINPAGSRLGAGRRSFASQIRDSEEFKSIIKENISSLLSAVSTEQKIIRIIKREEIGNIFERTWDSWTDNPTKALIKQLFRTDDQYTHIIALVPPDYDANEAIKTFGQIIKTLKTVPLDKIKSPMAMESPISKAIVYSARYNLQETIDILFAYAFAIDIGNVNHKASYNQEQPYNKKQHQKISQQERTMLHSELLEAINHNNIAEAERLIGAGADINAINPKTGQVALVQIAGSPVEAHVGGKRKSAIEWTQLLLELGANPNVVDGTGTTPLMALVSSAGMALGWESFVTNEAVDVAELLIAAGADINYVDRRGISIFAQAIASRNKDVVRLLLDDDTLKINFAGKEGESLLFNAVKNNDAEMTELLLERGAPVNGQIDNRVSPLHIAAIRGDKEMVKLLLEHGANPQAQDLYGAKPTTYAQLGGMRVDDAKWGTWQHDVIYKWREYADPLSFNDVSVILDMLKNVRPKDKRQKTTASNTTEAAQSESDKVILKYINNINKTNKEKGSSFQELAQEYHPDTTKNDPDKQAIMVRLNGIRDIQKQFAVKLIAYHDKKSENKLSEAQEIISKLKRQYNPYKFKKDPILRKLYQQLYQQIPNKQPTGR